MLIYALLSTCAYCKTVRDALHLAPHGCNFPMVAHLFMMYDMYDMDGMNGGALLVGLPVGTVGRERDDARKGRKEETDKREVRKDEGLYVW